MKARISLSVLALVLASFSFLTVSANSKPTTNKLVVHAQAADTATPVAPTCSDTTLISGIAADLKTIGTDLTTIPSTGAGGVYSIMIEIANARLKYETMPTPTDLGCSYLVTETIILFAEIQDFGLISMGSKLGLDTSADQPGVVSRLQAQLKNVTDLIGPVPAP